MLIHYMISLHFFQALFPDKPKNILHPFQASLCFLTKNAGGKGPAQNETAPTSENYSLSSCFMGGKPSSGGKVAERQRGRKRDCTHFRFHDSLNDSPNCNFQGQLLLQPPPQFKAYALPPHGREPFLRLQRQSSGRVSTRMMSGPIFRMVSQGMMNSSLGLPSPNIFPCPGTTSAFT